MSLSCKCTSALLTQDVTGIESLAMLNLFCIKRSWCLASSCSWKVSETDQLNKKVKRWKKKKSHWRVAEVVLSLQLCSKGQHPCVHLVIVEVETSVLVLSFNEAVCSRPVRSMFFILATDVHSSLLSCVIGPHTWLPILIRASLHSCTKALVHCIA